MGIFGVSLGSLSPRFVVAFYLVTVNLMRKLQSGHCDCEPVDFFMRFPFFKFIYTSSWLNAQSANLGGDVADRISGHVYEIQNWAYRRRATLCLPN